MAERKRIELEEVIQIAIDGPSSAGKSTIAKRVAKELGIDYIDTGAMYRALAYKILDKDIKRNDQSGINAVLKSCKIDFCDGRTFLDGRNISDLIRSPKITRLASDISALPGVRRKLVLMQREMGKGKSVVMDGRDIGTEVFPSAMFKFYLTATVEERAKRRWREMREKGYDVTLLEVKNDIAERDRLDSTRDVSPLIKAGDALEIDTTRLSIDQVVDVILDAVKKKHFIG